MEPEVRTVKKCLTTQILTAANREVVRYMGSPTYDVLLPEKCSLGRGTPLLQPADQDAGLVPAISAQKLLGIHESYSMIVIVRPVVVSTSFSEVMAVTSIIVHNLYPIYCTR